MTAPLAKPYTSLPDYADVAYVDGKLGVARGIVSRTSDPDVRRRWLETIDILLDQRSALAALHGPNTKTPDQWCAYLGATVIDADGWRDGTRAWDEPITREEFDQRLNRCTLDGRGYPMFLGLPAEDAS